MLFVISGGWFKVIILLYHVTLSYDKIKLPVVRVIWCLYSALLSSLYFGKHLLETINNYTLPFLLGELIYVEDTEGAPPPSPSCTLLLWARYNSSSEF